MNNFSKKSKVAICLATKDRHSEVALLLQSLRTQTFQGWNLYIYDQSQTPMMNAHFIQCLIYRLKLEYHRIKLEYGISNGVCVARNKLIEMVELADNGEDLVIRLDDDCIPEPDYLEKLIEGIDKGYDLVSGIIPLCHTPEIKRDNKFIGNIINEHKFDDKGNLIENKDECGYSYFEDKWYPTHQFRTNALMKRELLNIKYPPFLSTVGFREELFFSFKAILSGYKLGVCTGAKAYHLQTPSGGVRDPNYSQKAQSDHQKALDWIKETFQKEGDFLTKYNERLLTK